MWDDRTERAVDEAIDRVAGDLTNGAPAPNLKARVFERIEARDRSWWSARSASLAVAGAALLLVLAVIVVERSNVPPASSLASRPTARTVTTLVEVPARSLGRGIGAPQQTLPPPPPRFDMVSPIDQLAPDGLAVASIELAPLGSASSLRVPELSVPSIDLAPLPAIEDRPR